MSEGAPPPLESLVQFPGIAGEIERMAKIDEDMRHRTLENGLWDGAVDAKNTARMKEIVAKIGWPTISKVGKQASSDAWLLVQHADYQVEFQECCLALMKTEPKGEIYLRNIAMLEDRVRVNRNQPQMYGTQFRQDTGEHKPLPIEDAANVNERRREMGLGPLEEGVAEMYEAYGAPDQS